MQLTTAIACSAIY